MTDDFNLEDNALDRRILFDVTGLLVNGYGNDFGDEGDTSDSEQENEVNIATMTQVKNELE